MRFAILVLVACRSAAPVAVDPPQARCQVPGADAFDYLVGNWTGIESSTDGARKVLATSEVHVEPLLGGCAFEERSIVREDNKELFRARMWRSFDRGSGRWFLSYVDNNLNHQLYEGRPHDGGWAFHRTRLDKEGKPVEIRITWKKSATGVTKTIERSTDGGTTWVLGSVIELTAVRSDRA